MHSPFFSQVWKFCQCFQDRESKRMQLTTATLLSNTLRRIKKLTKEFVATPVYNEKINEIEQIVRTPKHDFTKLSPNRGRAVKTERGERDSPAVESKSRAIRGRCRCTVRTKKRKKPRRVHRSFSLLVSGRHTAKLLLAASPLSRALRRILSSAAVGSSWF